MEAVSIVEIARLSGVSPSIVSRALRNVPTVSNEKRERVGDSEN